MSKHIAIEPEDWIEKKFTFDFPVGAFPAIIERLRGTPARLEELAYSYPPDLLMVRPGGNWSIKEHVGHLYDLEELHEGRLDDFLAGLEVLRAADMTNKKTHVAQHNSNSIENLLSQFRATRRRFVERLEDVSEEIVTRSAMHPRLQKPMRLMDMAIFSAEHDDHHLASITHVARVILATASDKS